MSNYDRNLRDANPRNETAGVGAPRDSFVAPGPARSSSTWIGGAVVAVLLLIAIGYVFSDRSSAPSMVEHRASATDAAAPAVAPANPLPSPSVAPSPPKP